MVNITFYHLYDHNAEVVPARPERAWMNATPGRYAYRCLPLVVANRAGWEVNCPSGFTATWNGGSGQDSIRVEYDEPGAHPFASSHFGDGVLTFHSGYLIKTPEGQSLWCMGSPNEVKDGVQPLAGIIATSWLPFAFTMNWKFTRPGRVRFEKGESFAFLTLTRLADLEQTVPVEKMISEDPQAQAAYDVWAESRRVFSAKLQAGDPETVAQGWQRNYMRGTHPEGTPAERPTDHRTKLRIAAVAERPAARIDWWHAATSTLMLPEDERPEYLAAVPERERSRILAAMDRISADPAMFESYAAEIRRLFTAAHRG